MKEYYVLKNLNVPSFVCPYCGCKLHETTHKGQFNGYAVCPECYELFEAKKN